MIRLSNYEPTAHQRREFHRVVFRLATVKLAVRRRSVCRPRSTSRPARSRTRRPPGRPPHRLDGE